MSNLRLYRLCILVIPVLWVFSSSIASANVATETGTTYEVQANGLSVKIQFFTAETVRILKTPSGDQASPVSYAVIKRPDAVALVRRESDTMLDLSSSRVRVVLNKTTGRIAFYDANGVPLLNEKDYGSQFTPIKDLATDSYNVRQEFHLDNDEQIYGLGQFQQGRMSQRNQKLYLLQDILISAIPFFQSTKGYGLYWDNYSPTWFTDNPQDTSFESSVGDAVDYYFMYGGNADGVIAQMRELTGEVPMFPYWTFGYWQSRERYKSQDEIVGVVKKYRELGVPLDGIIQDWQYWGDNYHWNAMNFGNPEFPQPQKMIDDIHAMNAHMIISIWSSFGPKTAQYKELDKNGMLFDFSTWPIYAKNEWPPKPGAALSGVKVYDAYNPQAREIYWKYLKKGLFSYDVDGWWMDSTEPDHFNRNDKDYNQKTYLGSFRKFRNLYPLMTVGGVARHQREVSSDKRVFILTRSAFAGQQRYGANAWSGDVTADWPALKNQISAGLNFSLCGLPYWNADIGGFFLGKFPNKLQDANYRELYVRWLEFGAFTTMMRSHGTDAPREIYQFGEKGDWAYDAIDKYINLRYRLLPYIYSTSWDVSSHASTMMRALMMDFVRDPKALDINDQYMFGRSILVSPVTDSMYTLKGGKLGSANFSKIKSRRLYLPAGTQWVDFWTGERLNGGQSIDAKSPIDIIPLHVRTGSIIPMGPIVQYAGLSRDPLEIRIYLGANGEFVLYDDERDNYDYEKGKYSTIKFSWNDHSNTLTIAKRNGRYPGMKDIRHFNIVLVRPGNGTGLQPAVKIDKVVEYQGEEMSLSIPADIGRR